MISRNPPADVLRELRREVGFGCPVPGCGNPYLHWHHFDPPWREQQHHNPEGMIALCAEHAAKADAGAFTKEQLREFKLRGKERATKVRGSFDWMRYELLAVVGGNFYHETPIIFQLREEPVIWFNRDEDSYLLLNIRMLTISGEPRMCIQDNFWITQGNPEHLESPPSGKRLRVKYANGDMLYIEFLELDSVAAAQARYPGAMVMSWDVRFPITAVEVHEKVAGTELEFGPKMATLLGHNVMTGCFTSRCRVGLRIG